MKVRLVVDVELAASEGAQALQMMVGADAGVSPEVSRRLSQAVAGAVVALLPELTGHRVSAPQVYDIERTH